MFATDILLYQAGRLAYKPDPLIVASEVRTLARSGLLPADIARALDMPLEQIELILKPTPLEH